MRNMRLNEKKCKDMVINFLKYQPTVITPIQLNGIVIDRVSSYKLLGVIISNDLSWNEHCDSIHKKATKRLFVLRTLKRVGLVTNDLVLVYGSIVRSIVEYASPVLDCEQSLFFFRFSERNARARERRSRETRETRAISHARGHLRV